MQYKEELERMRKELYERKKDLSSELLMLPEGELFCSDNDGYRKYYQRIPATGNRKKERRYGIKTDPEMMSKMVRKEYVVNALKSIDRDLNALDFAVKKYRPIDERSVMEKFVKKYPELERGIYKNSFNEKEWKKGFRNIENYHPESLRHTAADGTMKRSKNELYIASRLDHYGQIYVYDCNPGIPGLSRAFDSIILRLREYKIIYWEHFGMMDVPSYLADSKQKLKEYEAVGIVPWDNLLVTYDTLEGGLRAELIEAAIKGWLL